ncbi:MAG TPA: ABC transporter permease [Candidatus Saccharimonadales bacterium]|nr:ABC transporter permease [Candidatus Saccharimonadales bacterium]
MFAAVKSEIRKILTVRSTYAILLVTVLLLGLFSFYATGFRASAAQLLDPNLLKEQIQQAVISTGLLGSIVGLLLVTNEYRYNTIMYTLTSSNSRTKVFFAKFIAVTAFSAVFTLIVAILAPVLTLAGVAVHGGAGLAPQTLQLSPLFWQVLFVGWGYSIFSFVIAMLIRVQVGAISAVFLIPAMVEPLLGLAMKKDAVYLPFNALQSVVVENSSLKALSSGAAAGVTALYVAGLLIVAWVLFHRRDAN